MVTKSSMSIVCPSYSWLQGRTDCEISCCHWCWRFNIPVRTYVTSRAAKKSKKSTAHFGLLNTEDEDSTILRNVGNYQSTRRHIPEDFNLTTKNSLSNNRQTNTRFNVVQFRSPGVLFGPKHCTLAILSLQLIYISYKYSILTSQGTCFVSVSIIGYQKSNRTFPHQFILSLLTMTFYGWNM